MLILTTAAWANGIAPEAAPGNMEQSAPKEPPGAADVTVFNFGDHDAQCLRWTDGCRTCTREGCSNIGIACQPAAPACTEKKPEQPKQ